MLETHTEDAVTTAGADTGEEAQKLLITHGTGAWTFGFPGVTVRADSQVSVSLTEVDNNNTPVLGLATTQVMNVVPHADGTMTVRYHVGWNSNIRVLFNFIIVN